jgi:hypothetical protein
VVLKQFVRLGGVAALAVVATCVATPHAVAGQDRAGPGMVSAKTDKAYVCSGSARVISDIDHKEHTYAVTALVTAGSLEEARGMAKDALSASAAIFGSVVAVYVRDVY